MGNISDNDYWEPILSENKSGDSSDSYDDVNPTCSPTLSATGMWDIPFTGNPGLKVPIAENILVFLAVRFSIYREH